MATTNDKALLDLRGWALGTWVGDTGKAVPKASLYNAHKRKVAEMQSLGWVREDAGSLFLTQAGLDEIERLRPRSMPKLTAVQEELLTEALEKPSLPYGLDYAPIVKLIAYGAVEPRERKFGLMVVATDMAREWARARAPEPEPEEEEALSGPTP